MTGAPIARWYATTYSPHGIAMSNVKEIANMSGACILMEFKNDSIGLRRIVLPKIHGRGLGWTSATNLETAKKHDAYFPELLSACGVPMNGLKTMRSLLQPTIAAVS